MDAPEAIHNHTQSPDQSVRAEPGSHVQIVRVDLGRETLALILALALVIGACGLIMGLNLSRQRSLEASFLDLDRKYRMFELKLDDWTVVAHRAGLTLPGDYARGPQGNLEKESFVKPAAKPLKEK